MTEKEFRWVHVNSKDELEAFYRGVLPNIITEARAHGYAIGVHGSLHRDLDLIAVPWTDDYSDKDELAHAIQEAALGPVQASYQWERKPNGRMAVSFPICWAEISPTFKRETNLAHIDLSVMGVTARPEVGAIDSALAEEQRKFRQETLRTSEQFRLLERWVSNHKDAHTPGPWSRGCEICKLVEETEELQKRPINTPRSPPLARHPLHAAIEWIACSQGGIWRCVACDSQYVSPPWTKDKVLLERCPMNPKL